MNKPRAQAAHLLLLAAAVVVVAAGIALDLTARAAAPGARERRRALRHPRAADAAQRRRRSSAIDDKTFERRSTRAGRSAQVPRAGDPQPDAGRREGDRRTTCSSPSPTRTSEGRQPLILAVRAQPHMVMATTEVDASTARRASSAARTGWPTAARPANPTTPTTPTGASATWRSDRRPRDVPPGGGAGATRRQAVRSLRATAPGSTSGATPRAVRSISFVDIYEGRFKDSDVRGKVVVVGADAPSCRTCTRPRAPAAA